MKKITNNEGRSPKECGPIEFKVGDRVLKIATKLSNKADSKAGKLYDKFEGPYIIKRKISPIIYELKILKGKSVGKWNKTILS